jgi:nicotinate (nicotinamide) nucleotide adenylyltransferase
MSNFEKLVEFRDANYGGKPENIDEETYQLALSLLNHITKEVEIFLTYNKSVQFEFNNGDKYLEIEVFSNKFSIWGNNTDIDYGDNGIEFDGNMLFEAINHIKIFYNGIPSNSVLFTGAFNPPTIAHHSMIQSALNRHLLAFDYVIMGLSNQGFLDKKQRKVKDESGFAFSEQQRLEMMLEMTYEDDRILIFGIERGYTYEVLCVVKEKYNIKNLYFAMGSDKLGEIQKWGYHDKLLNEFNFYVLVRGDDNIKAVDKRCEAIFKNHNFVTHFPKNQQYKDISATMVRMLYAHKEDYSKLVHPKVYNYLSKM